MVVVPVPLLMNVTRLIVVVLLAATLPNEGLAAVRTGAVLEVTVSEAVSVAMLKAVVPPFVVVSAVVPLVPLVASQAR